MQRLPFILAVLCAFQGTAAAEPAKEIQSAPLPPKHVSASDSRFEIEAPEGVNIGDYNQLGDDPKSGTPISFVHPQDIECIAAGAHAFKIEGATEATIDLSRGDVPMINFAHSGVPRSLLLPAPAMACAMTGDTKAGVGKIATIVNGGTNAGNSGFTNFDSPQTVTCFRGGRQISRTFAIALSVGAANGKVGYSYTDEDGQPITREYDGNKIACIVETVGLELTKAKETTGQ